MNELLKINYDTETPTVSARDLHEQLHIKTAFKDWFPRMCEYGFEDGKDFSSKMSEMLFDMRLHKTMHISSKSSATGRRAGETSLLFFLCIF